MKIKLDVPRYSGEYDLNIDDPPLSNLEWRWIKKISGYMPLTLEQGWEGGDPDMFIAFAVIALRRAGMIDKDRALAVADELADVPFGTAIMLVGDEEKKQEPPTLPAATPETEQRNGNTGRSSSTTSAPQGDTPSPTGAPA